MTVSLSSGILSPRAGSRRLRPWCRAQTWFVVIISKWTRLPSDLMVMWSVQKYAIYLQVDNNSNPLISILQCHLVNKIHSAPGTTTYNPVFSILSQVLIHTWDLLNKKTTHTSWATYMYDCAFSFGSVPNFVGCNVLHCTKCNVPPALVLEQILCSTERFVKINNSPTVHI